MMDDESTDPGIAAEDGGWEELQRSYEFAIASGKKSRRIALLLYAFALLGGLAGIVWMVTDRLEDQEKRLDGQRREITEARERISAAREVIKGQWAYINQQVAAQKAALKELENNSLKLVEDVAAHTRKSLAEQQEAHASQLHEYGEERERLLDRLQAVQADSRQLLQSASREAAQLADEAGELAALRIEQEKLLRSVLEAAEDAKRELLSRVLQRLTYPIRPKKRTYLPLLQMYVVGEGSKELQESGSFLVEDLQILGRDDRRLWPPDPEPRDLASGETVEFHYLGCEVYFRLIYLSDGILRHEVGAEFTWAAADEAAACELDRRDGT